MASAGGPECGRQRSWPTTAPPTRSSRAPGGSTETSSFSSAGERAATASTAPPASMTASDASSARPAARATSKMPSPSATAAATSASAARP